MTEMDLGPTLNTAVAVVDAAAKVRDYIGHAKASATRRAYASDWRHFERWCHTRGLPSLPATPEGVAMYVSDLADSRSTSTIERRLSSIAHHHREATLESPTTHTGVRETIRGIRRVHGVHKNGKRALSAEDFKAALAALPDTLWGPKTPSEPK